MGISFGGMNSFAQPGQSDGAFVQPGQSSNGAFVQPSQNFQMQPQQFAQVPYMQQYAQQGNINDPSVYAALNALNAPAYVSQPTQMYGDGIMQPATMGKGGSIGSAPMIQDWRATRDQTGNPFGAPAVVDSGGGGDYGVGGDVGGGGFGGYGPSDTSYSGMSDALAAAGQNSNVSVESMGTDTGFGSGVNTSGSSGYGQNDDFGGYGFDSGADAASGVGGVGGPGSTSAANASDFGGMDSSSDSGGGGGGGSGGCVIATHAVANGSFTKREKQKAVVWCVKTLHNSWWGEAIRRGYRFHGNKAIKAGKAHEYYEEFRDFVRFATGTKRNAKTAKTFAFRSVQFFFTGLFVKEKV